MCFLEKSVVMGKYVLCSWKHTDKMNFWNTNPSKDGDCLEVKFLQHGESKRLFLNPTASYWLYLVSRSPALQFTALSTKFCCFCSWFLPYQIIFDKYHLRLPLQITRLHFPSTSNQRENRIKKVEKNKSLGSKESAEGHAFSRVMMNSYSSGKK